MKLELENIVKKYGDKTALGGVSLTLGQGVYGLLGPNGAGKSTMMNVITGNLRPDEGVVKADGESIRSLGRRYREVLGYAPQQQGLYESFSGRRFLAFMATLKEIPRSRQKSEIDRVLKYVNLTEAAKKPIGAYSGGMKQRILSDIQSIADEIILLKSGEIADRGTVSELCRKYSSEDMERVYMKLFGEDGENDKANPV